MPPLSSREFRLSCRTSLSVMDRLRRHESVEAVASSIEDLGRGLLLVMLEGLVRRRIKSGRLCHAEGGIVGRGL